VRADPCPVGCGHPWHGLPCTWNEGRCGCPGPWTLTREAYADMSSHYTTTPEKEHQP